MSDDLNAKYKKLAEEGGPLCGLFAVRSVDCCNHSPHPFMVSGRHVTHAAEHHGGLLGEATLRAIPCEHPGCGAPYDAHTADRVLFLQLLRHLTNKEAAAALFAIKAEMLADKIAGVAFVDTPEKYRIAPAVE